MIVFEKTSGLCATIPKLTNTYIQECTLSLLDVSFLVGAILTVLIFIGVALVSYLNAGSIRIHHGEDE